MPAGAFATGKLTPEDYGRQVQQHHDNFIEGFGHAAWDGIAGIGEGLWNHVTSQVADTYNHVTGRDRTTPSQLKAYKQAGGKVIDAGSPSHVFFNAQMGAAHQALQLLDTPENMYRLAMLNYHKYGWGGVVGSMAPMVVGGVAGALTGGAGAVATAGEFAGEAGAAEAAAAAAESATVAGETAAAGATTDAAATAGQTVAQRMYMARYAAAKDAVMDSPVGTVAKIVGMPFKAAYKMGSSPVLAGAQLPYTSLYLADGNIGDMWKQAQDPNALNQLKLPGTIGSGLSDLLTGNKNTWLAGTTDAIVGLTSTPFMVGRALKYSTRGVEGLRAVDSVAVDAAYHNNRGYRNALDQIIKIGEGKFGPAAEDGIAGAIARTMPTLSPIAHDLAEVVAKEGTTGYDLSKRIGELADVGNYIHGVNLPTMGIYGMLKMYGKLSDGAVPTYFSRVLGQSPMAVSELNKSIETGTIELGDSQGAYKLGQLLQQTGMPSRDITRIVNHLITTQDLGHWENVVKSALKENFYQRIDRLMWQELGLNTERLGIAFRQGKLSDGDLKFLNDNLKDPELRNFYTTVRQTISDRVDRMVGSSSAGKVGLFGTNAVGDDISRIGEDGSRSAAITENQAGKLHLPDYKKFDKEFAEMFKKYRKVVDGDVAFTEMMGSGMSRTAEVIDSWVNDRFFKPMALLTPGWALRVSLSELILNTARLGPANMAAAGITASAANTERRAAKRAIYWSGKMTDHLSSRAVALRQHIDDLKAELEDRGINADTNQFEIEKMQQELDALNQHIRWLKSPAGTPAPGSIEEQVAKQAAAAAKEAEAAAKKKVVKETLFAGNEPFIAPHRERLISDFLGSKGYKVNATQAQNLSMIMRGVLAGTKLTTLNAIGKDQFIKYGAYLIERHGGYMPHAVDSVHKSIFNNIDWNAEYESVTKTKTIKDKTTGLEIEVPKTKKIIGRGDIKTKMVLMSPDDFSTAAFGQKRYFEGWFYGANTLAQSELARPLAAAYLRLYQDAGLRGEDLHNAAVTEAERILANAPDRIKDIMARSKTSSIIHDQEDPMGSWASTLVDRLEGIAAPAKERVLSASERRAGVRAAIGESTVHTSLLEDIANNTLPEHVNEFYHQYAFDVSGNQLPKEYFPTKVITRTPELMGASRLLEKLSSWGHAKVLGPMVNYMSRQPTYIAEFVQARQGFEEAVKRGNITADQADVLAETSAMKNMVKYIHNPSDKTKFEEMISWAAPFYFAQNQAMRRMGRLLGENPGAFMQYLYTMTQIQGMVNNAVDQNGMSIKTIPGLMLFGLNPTASLSSLSTMDPFFIPPDAGAGSNGPQSILDILSPKFGPFVTVMTKMLYYTNPSLNDTAAGRFVARNLEGNIGAGESMPQFLFQSAVPNSVTRNLIAGLTGYAFANTGFGGNALAALDNSYVQAEIEALRYAVSNESEKYWNYLGTKVAAEKMNGGKSITGGYKAQLFYSWQANNWNINSKAGAHSMQNLLDTARQHTMLLWLLKSTIGSVSPVSIGIGQADQGAMNTLQNYAKNPKYKGNYMKAVDAFTKDHPYAGVDTLAKSISTGGYYPETKTAFQWLDNNSELARQYPYAAMALAPDMSGDTKYYQPAHTLMLNIGLRNRETPNDFVNQFLIQQGNAFYYNWIKPTYEKKHETDKSAAHKWRTDAINWYGANHNTTWLNSYQAGASATDKIYAIKQFMDMTSPTNSSVVSQFNPQQAKTVTLLRQLRNAIMGNNNDGYYQQMTQAITSGKIDSVTAKDNWQNWLDGIIKKYPDMKQGIMTLYYNLG